MTLSPRNAQAPARDDYPSNYRPGMAGPDADRAWELLDIFPPDAIPRDARFLLAGMITGELSSCRARHEELVQVLSAALHALKSYEFGNGAPDLARSTAEHIEGVIARVTR